MDERRLAEQFAQTGNLMDLCANEDWLKESAQVEADCGGNVDAGLALRDYATRLGAPTVEQLQIVKLQSTLFSELRGWMESWQLGLSFEATYTEARRLIRHHLQYLSPEQQTLVKALLADTGSSSPLAQNNYRSQTVRLLSELLTQEDWQTLADTAAQGMADGVLNMRHPEVVTTNAS
ncbi:MAG: hypothetical protein WBA10_02340 [Elainellaceae cyanobacterium]